MQGGVAFAEQRFLVVVSVGVVVVAFFVAAAVDLEAVHPLHRVHQTASCESCHFGVACAPRAP